MTRKIKCWQTGRDGEWVVQLEEGGSNYHSSETEIEYHYHAKLTRFQGKPAACADQWLAWWERNTIDDSRDVTRGLFIAAWESRSPDFKE